MNRSLSAIVEKAKADTTSGSSEILVSALEGLSGCIKSADRLAKDDLKEFAFSLHRAKPAMAPLLNLSNSILCLIEDFSSEFVQPDRLSALFSDWLEEERAANQKIADLAREEIDADRLITLSYSSTVLNVLKAIGKDREFIVTVAESLPSGEGRRMAKVIASYGVETEIIPDSFVAGRMKDVEVAIVGADAVTCEGLMNKVGTYALTLAAAKHDIPSYALCGWPKFCPMRFEDLGFSERRLGKNLTESHQMFESTPLGCFYRFVTDRGVLRSGDVAGRLKDYRKALVWSEIGLRSAK